jgi:hypothetical protein
LEAFSAAGQQMNGTGRLGDPKAVAENRTAGAEIAVPRTVENERNLPVRQQVGDIIADIVPQAHVDDREPGVCAEIRNKASARRPKCTIFQGPRLQAYV